VFLVIFFSMVFGIAWSVARSDIQGSFTVAGYMVTFGLFVTCGRAGEFGELVDTSFGQSVG